MKGEVAHLVRTTMNDSDDESNTSNNLASPESSDSATMIDNQESEISDADEAQQQVGDLVPIRSAAQGRRMSTVTLRRASMASWNGPQRKIADEENAVKSKQTQETAQQGKVSWNVYLEYAKNSNVVAVGFYMFALLSAQTMQVAGSYWLKNFSERNEVEGGNSQVGKFIGIYLALGLGSSLLVIFQNLILWIFCSIEVCWSLCSSRIAFERNPVSNSSTRLRGKCMSGWHSPSSVLP